jgi:hypothetical protein
MITTYILVVITALMPGRTTALSTMAVDGYRTQASCQQAATAAKASKYTADAYCVPQQREVQ